MTGMISFVSSNRSDMFVERSLKRYRAP